MLLAGLCTIVGDLGGTEPQCLDTAAVMLEAAEHLGIPLRLVPVAMVIADPNGSGETFMLAGQTTINARAAEGHAAAAFASGMSGEAGHVVLVSDERSMVFDPAFRQVPERFAEPVSVALTVRDTHPDNDIWHMPSPGRPNFAVAYVIKHADLPEADALVARARSRYRPLAHVAADRVLEWVGAGARGEPPTLMVDSAFGPVPATLDHA